MGEITIEIYSHINHEPKAKAPLLMKKPRRLMTAREMTMKVRAKVAG